MLQSFTKLMTRNINFNNICNGYDKGDDDFSMGLDTYSNIAFDLDSTSLSKSKQREPSTKYMCLRYECNECEIFNSSVKSEDSTDGLRQSQSEVMARNEIIRKQEHHTLLNEKEKEVTKLRTEYSHLLTRYKSLEKLANEREPKVVSPTKDYKKLQLINEDLKRQNSTYNRDVITLQRDCRQLRTRNEDLSRKLTENEQQVDTLKKDCSQLRTRNEDLKRQNSTYDRDVITLQRDCRQIRTRNEDLSRKLTENEQQVDTLKKDCSQLRTRNEDLSRQLSENEQQLDTLKKDCVQLRTRLSEVASMQLREGNPKLANLSDQNRPDKLAERFSELYDNQWTDCYQILMNHLKKTEEESIHILLRIVQTSYDICLDRSQSDLTSAKDLLFTVAGTSDGEHEKSLDIFIKETLHKLKSYRNKSFKSASSKIIKEIQVILVSTIGEPEVADCRCFIEECISLCWLMCIKDPPMYIFCDKEAVFDQNKFVPYTKTGPEVSYVVWPALYLHTNGPLMRKGVAQGEIKKERARNRKINAANWVSLGPYHKQEY